MTLTSRMAAVTAPSRFGFTAVSTFFGIVRESKRDVTMTGELLRNNETGEVVEFVAREGMALITRPTEV